MRAEVIEKGEGSLTIKLIADDNSPTEGLILSMTGMGTYESVSCQLSNRNTVYIGGITFPAIAQFQKKST